MGDGPWCEWCNEYRDCDYFTIGGKTVSLCERHVQDCDTCGEPVLTDAVACVVKHGREWYVCDKCREQMCQGEGAGYVEL